MIGRVLNKYCLVLLFIYSAHATFGYKNNRETMEILNGKTSLEVI